MCEGPESKIIVRDTNKHVNLYTCFTGKATVQCSPNKMVVVLEKASMPGIDTNYLKLRDQKCSLTSNGTHIIGTMSFSTCGTKIEVYTCNSLKWLK